MLKTTALKIDEKIYECNKHIEKLNNAKDYLQKYMPLSVEKYSSVDKITGSFIDQLCFRFSKLQDTLGESLFRYILILAEENVKKMTFIDMLIRLEELEILNKTEWLELREIRNEIAHEYSYNQEEVVANINMIYNKAERLIDIFRTIDKFITERF